MAAPQDAQPVVSGHLSSAATQVTWLEQMLEPLSSGLRVDTSALVQKVRQGLTPHGSTKSELLNLAAETAAALTTQHTDWSDLAGRILVQDLYLDSPAKFTEFVAQSSDVFTPEFLANVLKHGNALDNAIVAARDREFSFFAMRTLRQSYLLKGERPQYMWMRVALAINGSDLGGVLKNYELMSQKFFTHATPTLFNAGTKEGQLASCFLVAMKDGTIEGIFDTLKECALISRHSGGIGLHCSNVPASTSGSNSGLIPMLRVFNNASRFVDQGGNKRPGAISITIEPWHADVFAFLDLRKNHGKEEYRARDLFYALWIPDLFMLKVEKDEDWFLFSPDKVPGLQDVYGEAFAKLYNSYVEKGLYDRSVPARKLWNAILDAQVETGNPSLLYKDACNAKSNQQNLGVIKSSNLCTEIVEFSSPEETAVCNLASLGLPRFISEGKFDFLNLHSVTKLIVKNLNRMIDTNVYPLDNARKSNLRHRPIAIGVQGLAEVYFALRLDFDSVQASTLNAQIFETIYHASLESSMELASENGPYSTYAGSPASLGKLQMDLWHYKVPEYDQEQLQLLLHRENHISASGLWDWNALRNKIKEHGLYNSLLTSVMPTASSSQILGNSESIEPITSNIYSRRTMSGEFQVVNRYLEEELEEIGQWTEDIREEIIANGGSIQHLDVIPADIRRRYRTVWELSMRAVIDQSVGRAPFIDHSQSLNLFLAQPTHRQLSSMHFNAWRRGLKTGLYYLRTRPAADPIPFTISHDAAKRASRLATPNADRTGSRAETLTPDSGAAGIGGSSVTDSTSSSKRLKRSPSSTPTAVCDDYVCEMCTS